MGFEEVKRTGRPGRHVVDGVYRYNEKTKIGVLRITKKGVDYLREKVEDLEVDKRLKLYIDKENLSLAFKRSDEGEFRLSGSKKNHFSLVYQDLSKLVRKNMQYMIELSKDFTFILVPVADKDEVVEGKLEAKEEVKEEVKEETEKPSSKSRKKKEKK